MKIPLFDLHAQYLSVKSDMDEAIASVIAQSAYIRGPFVQRFEEEYARDYGVKHCISCANGTDAIYIVLKQLGIGPGDEVITTANSWISSSETITQTGARVVFADTEDAYYTLNPVCVASKISPRTRAIVAVHLLGQAADVHPLQALCKQHGLYLIEDTAQAHYASYKGQRVGTFGTAATFSFYPGKNLGAYGDAGAIVTDDDELAAKCRSFARHGSSPTDKHDHTMEGINSRMDGLQASVLLTKLPHIHDWTQARRRIAADYHAALGGVEGILLPATRPGCEHVWHVYSVRVANARAVQKKLAEAGIASTQHYPTPLPFLKAYQYLGARPGDFPCAERHSREMLSLPIYPEMTEEAVAYVAENLKSALGNR